MIDAGKLIAAGVAPTQAKMFVEPLKAACALFAIDTPTRIGAFIGQLRVESANFTRLEENLRYTTARALCLAWPSRFRNEVEAIPYLREPVKLALYVYSNRNGNGGPDTMDPWDFRGSGLVQLTGRANFTKAQIDLNRPYVSQPELVRRPSDACLTSAHYWFTNGLNQLADAWNIDRIGTVINRGPGSSRLALHADERRQYSEEAVGAFA